MSRATPKSLTCGFIFEEGVEVADLEKIVFSMAQTAKDAGVLIVAGDTKVIEGKGGLYINTDGVGFLPEGDFEVSSSFCGDGDLILLSGTLGDHHAAILSARMGIENTIQSDYAPLHGMVSAVLDEKIQIRTMRDVTRGGLATVLHEFAAASKKCLLIQEDQIPVTAQVKGFRGFAEIPKKSTGKPPFPGYNNLQLLQIQRPYEWSLCTINAVKYEYKCENPTKK